MTNQSKPGKVRSNGLWNHVISENWIGSTGSRWSSSGFFSRIHYVGNSRRDSQDDEQLKRKDHLHVNVQ